MIVIIDPEIEFLLCIFHVVEGVQVNAWPSKCPSAKIGLVSHCLCH